MQSVAEFIKATRISRIIDYRGGALSLIDEALRDYHAASAARGDNMAELMMNGYLIVKRCNRYLKKSKFVKFNSGDSQWKEISDSSYEKRCAVVISLRNSALQELAILAPNFGDRLKYKESRKRFGYVHENGRAISNHYVGERNHYVDLKRQENIRSGGRGFATVSPFSGTNVIVQLEEVKTLGRGAVSAMSPEHQEIRRGLLNTDVVPEDLAIYRMLGGRIGDDGGGHRVTYMNKIRRFQYMMLPGEGGLFYNYQEQLVDMDVNFMYAIGLDGCLFAAPPVNNEAVGRRNGPEQFFNHTSFKAGKPVICAGMIKIVRGRLEYMDNNSGHYQPSDTDLISAFNLFVEEGVDLQGVKTTTHTLRDAYKNRQTDETEFKAVDLIEKKEWIPREWASPAAVRPRVPLRGAFVLGTQRNRPQAPVIPQAPEIPQRRGWVRGNYGAQ